MSEYQPGVCNIGRDERRKRRTLGAVSFLAAAAYVGVVLGTGRPAGLLLGSFPLLFGGFVGVVQDRMGFCAGFGALARYDLSGSGGGAGSVAEEEAVKQDRIKAFQVVAVAAAAAVLATMAVYGVGAAL
ncbi:hypothetical protein HZS55_21790 [Halosimplex rubrum]|uniref:DUF2892 domain-containing protein n=1 Tax=Halosimplex rubrum TaxID=869889 RepID=A0A7D5P6K6_9EURY|nr:hypothetical protein [Halosimplex rubrum]QLH79764.1 hypothetical protein HZS55_21790 [Halosimplex rubrum]